MIRTIVLTVAGSIAVVWLTVLGLAPASAFAPAAASVTSYTAVRLSADTQHPVNWTAEAYNALLRWEKQPTAGSLDRLVSFGFHLSAKPDQADIDQLAANVYGGGDVDLAEQYVYEDLTNCSGC